ncbi:MAG: response regulator [Rhodobacterales bacterium]|nr:response regulator [Rhodobacterales bacterium]
MSLSRAVAPHLPFLRRYARALTGTQASGDAYVRNCLEAIVAAPEQFDDTHSPKVTLYRIFHAIWNSTQPDQHDDPEALTGFERRVAGRLRSLTPQNRQALLMTALEGFTEDEVAVILDVDPTAVPGMIADTLNDISRQIATDVLIIEDEPIISIDLTAIVEDMGHRVVNVATTHAEAVAAAAATPPGLVLADIQLADGSSGIDAVRDILKEISAPVIFITAFPDRLLTGERPEPTFLITKPFQLETVKAAIGQALFFAHHQDASA